MKTRNCWLLSAGLGLIVVAASTSAPAAPLMRQTFEDGTSGWVALGQNDKVAVTHEAEHVKEGKGALQFDYRIGKGDQSVLLLPTPNAALAKAKSFRFWIKTDYTTPIAVVLQEQEGGRYTAFFTVPSDGWQQVELSPSDFILGEDASDPKDPDHRLDLDQVGTIGIADLGQFFAQIDDPAFTELLGVKTGPHSLYLDDFEVSDEALPDAISSVNGEVRLDQFARPQLSWIGVGGTRLSLSSAGKGGAGVEGGRGLRAEYRQAPGKIAGFAKRVPRGILAGTDRLMFDAASAKPARLLVQLEELGGGKYNTTVDLPGESTIQKVSLKFSEFTVAEDSKVKNGHLDLNQVNQVLILDATGVLDMTSQDNTLRITGLHASPAK